MATVEGESRRTTPITGTDAYKIDQLTQEIVKLKATLRIYMWIMGLAFPIIISVLALLVAKTIDNSAQLAQMMGVHGGGKR